MEKATGGDAQRTRFGKGTESPPTLHELGVDKKTSMVAQRHALNTGANIVLGLLPDILYRLDAHCLKKSLPVPSINSSTLKHLGVLDTARLDELFDHTGNQRRW